MKIPHGWKIKAITEVANVIVSPVDKKSYSGQREIRLCNYTDVYYNAYIVNTMSFMRATASDNEITKFSLQKEDVVITKDSESPDDIGVSAYVKENLTDVICGYHLTILRPYSDCCGKFLSETLSLESVRKDFYRFANGITRFGLISETYDKVKILFPPLPEQKKIAEILSCWDEAIEKNENLITAKKTFKRGIMQKLLSGQVRFKGFNGKAEYSKLKGLVKEVSHRNRNSKAGTVLSVTNTSGFVVQTDHFDRSVASTDISNYKIVRQGQFGFNPSRVNVGSIAMLEEDIEGALSPMYVIFETVDGKLLPEYMKQFIKSSWFIGHVRCLTQGSVRDSLSFDALEQIRIFAPSIDEQKRIADTLSAIDKEIKLLEQKRDSLKKQKKGLMQKLLTGKIRVKV
jgi:type I restriction enzyme, S subunit